MKHFQSTQRDYVNTMKNCRMIIFLCAMKARIVPTFILTCIVIVYFFLNRITAHRIDFVALRP